MYRYPPPPFHMTRQPLPPPHGLPVPPDGFFSPPPHVPPNMCRPRPDGPVGYPPNMLYNAPPPPPPMIRTPVVDSRLLQNQNAMDTSKPPPPFLSPSSAPGQPPPPPPPQNHYVATSDHIQVSQCPPMPNQFPPGPPGTYAPAQLQGPPMLGQYGPPPVRPNPNQHAPPHFMPPPPPGMHRNPPPFMPFGVNWTPRDGMQGPRNDFYRPRPPPASTCHLPPPVLPPSRFNGPTNNKRKAEDNYRSNFSNLNSAKKKLKNVNKRELPENNAFYCDRCDRGFKTHEKFQEHNGQHQQCRVEGCTYTAAPKLVELHYNFQHRTGLAKKIWQLESQEDLDRWRQDRKKNYPTAENKERKRKEWAERRQAQRTDGILAGRGRGQANRGRGRGVGRNSSNVGHQLSDSGDRLTDPCLGLDSVSKSESQTGEGDCQSQDGGVRLGLGAGTGSSAAVKMEAGQNRHGQPGQEPENVGHETQKLGRGIQNGSVKSQNVRQGSQSGTELATLREKLWKQVEQTDSSRPSPITERTNIVTTNGQQTLPADVDGRTNKRTDRRNKQRRRHNKRRPAHQTYNRQPTLAEKLSSVDVRRGRSVIMQCIKFVVQHFDLHNTKLDEHDMVTIGNSSSSSESDEQELDEQEQQDELEQKSEEQEQGTEPMKDEQEQETVEQEQGNEPMKDEQEQETVEQEQGIEPVKDKQEQKSEQRKQGTEQINKEQESEEQGTEPEPGCEEHEQGMEQIKDVCIQQSNDHEYSIKQEHWEHHEAKDNNICEHENPMERSSEHRQQSSEELGSELEHQEQSEQQE